MPNLYIFLLCLQGFCILICHILCGNSIASVVGAHREPLLRRFILHTLQKS